MSQYKESMLRLFSPKGNTATAQAPGPGSLRGNEDYHSLSAIGIAESESESTAPSCGHKMSPPSPKPIAPGPRIEDIIEGETQVAIEDPVRIYIGHENTLLLRRTLLYVEENAAFILRLLFIKFLVIFIIMLPFGEFSLTDMVLMPCIGIVAASLANSVPIGGGVVFIPALHLLGLHMKLGVSFSFATMSVGNGIFGFLSWVARDKSLIIWESVPFALVPSWTGFLIGELLFDFSESLARKLFGSVCLSVAVFVLYILFSGGISNVFGQSDQVTYSHASLSSLSLGTLTFSLHKFRQEPLNSRDSLLKWHPLMFVSFVYGLLFIPNVAIGQGLVTFISLASLGTFSIEACTVTGIIINGWACWVPFIYHATVLRDVPWGLWITILPGIYLGAAIAPMVSQTLGPELVMRLFAFVLIATASMYFLF